MLGFHRSNREIARRIKREGLMPGQPKILEYLWFHDGASQKDISRECIIDKSTVTSLLKRMENLDLIRKETRPEDQRGVAIFLTDKGWEKAKRIRQVIYATDDAMWQGIPEEEKQQFMRTFHKIIANQKKWGD
ncbi:MarR family winged helix-turn-helix transcriptional regulator [Megasphaera elsdenii]|nr:MarR family transcriptional regulator [Megasphaera elsdenii]